MADVDLIATRTTVGLTQEGRDALSQVMAAGWFSTDRDAFKYAVAFALASNIEPTPDPATFSTIWNRGTLDPDDRLVTLAALLSPCNDQWDRIRRLGDAGLREMVKRNLHVGLPSDVLDVLDD